MDFSKIRHGMFFGLLALITLAFLALLQPFAYPIFWAAIIAGIFYPLYRWLTKKLKVTGLSAVITLVLVFVIIAVPLTIVTSLIIGEAAGVYSSLNDNRGQISETMQTGLNWIKDNAANLHVNIDDQFWISKFSDTAKNAAGYVFVTLKSFTQNSLIFVVMFILMMYTLFFFLRDGEKMLKALMHLCPLGDKYEKTLYQRFTSTVRATIKGSLIVGLIQGGLATILFLVTGTPAAWTLGVLCVVLSVIPATGSGIIWIPVGIVQLITGNIWQGLLILIFGAVIISTIDNLIRPVLVGKDTQMHPLMVLFTTLGGILLFGISGFVIGPVVASLFLSFWHMYEEYYKDELCHND